MLQRLQAIASRYGQRTPFVMVALGLLRFTDSLAWWRLTWLRLTTVGHIGRNVRVSAGVQITPGAYLTIGHDTHVGPRSTFYIGLNPRAHVMIGSNVWLSENCLLASMGRVEIGDDTLVGEFVSIRDSTHQYRQRGVAIRKQGDVIGSIRIESDVWIGRGCLIQGKPEGVVIGRGAIVAANSVVTGSIPPEEVWGGVPARFIRSRLGTPLAGSHPWEYNHSGTFDRP